MSHAPSTFGSMITSTLLPTRATISNRSSRIQGELSALTRVHNPTEPKSQALAISMKPCAGRVLGVGRDRVLEISEHDVDLVDQLGDLEPHLFDVRRHEMNHALEPDRQFAQRSRSTDGQRLEEIAWKLHRADPSDSFPGASCLTEAVHGAKPRFVSHQSLPAHQSRRERCVHARAHQRAA